MVVGDRSGRIKGVSRSGGSDVAEVLEKMFRSRLKDFY
jgi:hypothetical protein